MKIINNEIDIKTEELDATAIDFSILAQCDANINTYGKNNPRLWLNNFFGGVKGSNLGLILCHN